VIDFPLFNGRKMPEMRNYVQHTRGYFSIFLATRFYVKTILGTGEVKKTADFVLLGALQFNFW